MNLKDLLKKEYTKGEYLVNLTWGIVVVGAALEFGALISNPYHEINKSRYGIRKIPLSYVAQSK